MDSMNYNPGSSSGNRIQSHQFDRLTLRFTRQIMATLCEHMLLNRYGTYSIIFSLTGVVVVLPVWAAGTHAYGAISKVWQHIDIKLLLLLGLAFLCGSSWSLYQSKISCGFRSTMIPALFLVASMLQFLLLAFFVILKLVFNVD